MTKLPTNPFKFGDPVEGDYYLPRPELEKLVTQFILNRIHLVLIGPRRFGKTSFLLNLLKKLGSDAHPYVYVDIFNITSHRDFLNQLLRALRTKTGWTDKLKMVFAKLRPKITSHIDINPSLDFSFDSALESEHDVKEMIQDVLEGLSKLGQGLIFVIDEFQKVAEIHDEGWLEATLRTHMQQLRNTSFIFTGSRRSVIYDMLNNAERPLYKFCQSIEFPPFQEEFTDWILDRFENIGIQCERSAIDHLRAVVQNTPNYVQMICFHLVVLGKNHITTRDVDLALKIVVQQNAYAYQTLLGTLTPIQQRTLRLAAKEEQLAFSKEIMNHYEITSGAALASAVRALKDKQILDEEASRRGTIVFDDPLFALWLKMLF